MAQDQALTLDQWCRKAGLDISDVHNDQRLFTAWYEGESWEAYVPRHVAIERAARALLAAHDAPYTTGDSHDSWLISCSEAREALRKALAGSS